MKKTRLENVCNAFLEEWSLGHAIEEEQVHIFLDGILDFVALQEDMEKLSSYKRVADRLNEMWQYREFQGMSPEQTFIYGSMWGAIQLAAQKLLRDRQKESIDALVAKYKDSLWLFRAISQSPGIKHKDLAKKGNQSPSQLSQFVNSVWQDGLITFHRMGREKYYFLQRDGELVYEKLKPDAEEKQRVDEPLYKAIALNNIECETRQDLAYLSIFIYNMNKTFGRVNRIDDKRNEINNNFLDSWDDMNTMRGGFNSWKSESLETIFADN